MKRIILIFSSMLLTVLCFSLIAFVSYSPTSVIRNDWTGTWNSTYGELRLVSEDESIYGDYANVGVLYGTRVHDGQGGHEFQGTFVNYTLNKQGVIKFKIDDTNLNNSFTGKWKWTSPSNWTAWIGKKTSTNKPTLNYFYRVTGRSFDENWKPVTTDFNVEFFKNGIRHFIATGKNGSYSQVLPKGKWDILIKKAGYQDYKTSIVVTPNYPNSNPYHLVNVQLIK